MVTKGSNKYRYWQYLYNIIILAISWGRSWVSFEGKLSCLGGKLPLRPPPPPPLDETLRAQDLVMDGSVQENMLQAQLILNNQTGDSQFKIFLAYACIKLINILKNLGGGETEL